MARLSRTSVSYAASKGAKRDMLLATLRIVAAAIDDPDTSARDLAALTKRLIDIQNDIETLDQDTGGPGHAQAATESSPQDDSTFDAKAI